MKTKQHATVYVIVGFLLLLIPSEIFAQGCSMCKAVAETNIQGGGTAARGLNTGILYILFFPYIMAVLFAYLWKRHQKSLREKNIIE